MDGKGTRMWGVRIDDGLGREVDGILCACKEWRVLQAGTDENRRRKMDFEVASIMHCLTEINKNNKGGGMGHKILRMASKKQRKKFTLTRKRKRLIGHIRNGVFSILRKS